ncbi:MAG: hypothetical protein AAFP97_11665 [Pseudomonadota bacterium]
MRTLLLLIAILNALGALGSAMVSYMESNCQSFFTKIGAAFDVAFIEISIAVIAFALYKIYPVKTD